MFYGYRSGKYPITEKAWRKLAAAEEFAELRDASTAAIKGAATKAVDQRDFERLVKEAQPALEERQQRLAAEDAEIEAMRDDEETDPLGAELRLLRDEIKAMREDLRATREMIEASNAPHVTHLPAKVAEPPAEYAGKKKTDP